MPQLWRIHMYQRNRDGASPEQLQEEFGLAPEEVGIFLEAARLCFEKQYPLELLLTCGIGRESEMPAAELLVS